MASPEERAGRQSAWLRDERRHHRGALRALLDTAHGQFPRPARRSQMGDSPGAPRAVARGYLPVLLLGTDPGASGNGQPSLFLLQSSCQLSPVPLAPTDPQRLTHSCPNDCVRPARVSGSSFCPEKLRRRVSVRDSACHHLALALPVFLRLCIVRVVAVTGDLPSECRTCSQAGTTATAKSRSPAMRAMTALESVPLFLTRRSPTSVSFRTVPMLLMPFQPRSGGHRADEAHTLFRA